MSSTSPCSQTPPVASDTPTSRTLARADFAHFSCFSVLVSRRENGASDLRPHSTIATPNSSPLVLPELVKDGGKKCSLGWNIAPLQGDCGTCL